MQHLARDLEIFRLTHLLTHTGPPYLNVNAGCLTIKQKKKKLLTHDYPQPCHVTHKPGCLFLFFFLPPTSHTLPPQPSWHCETALLSVSYVRQDFIALAVILAVILYIRQPLFLIHSVLGDLLAMPRKTGCPPVQFCVPTNIFADPKTLTAYL